MNQKDKDQQIQSLQAKIRELEDYSQGGIKILFSGKANAQRMYQQNQELYEKLKV